MNKTYKLVYAIILNMIIMLLYLYFGQLNYEIEDNQVYSTFIANGEYHIIFLNYFFCAVVGVLQKLIYPVNAFTLSLVLLGFCSFVLITRVMLDKFNLIVATCITLFLNGFFAVNHYETVSFTLAPAILCAAGYLGIIHFSRQRKHVLGVSIGCLFVFVGSLIRFKIFVASTAVAFFFVVGCAVSESFKPEYVKKRRKVFITSLFEKKRMIAVILILVVCFISEFVSSYINTSTEELAYYAEYTAARSVVWDYPIPDYEDYYEEYDEIGIDENDILLLRKGYMDDEGAFSLKELYAISNIQKEYNKDNRDSLPSIIKTMIVSEFGNMRAIGDKGIACFAVALIVLAFLLIMKVRNYFVPLFLLIIAFILYLYLWTTLKVPFRAVYEIWICSACFLFYSFSLTELKDVVKKVYGLKRNICLSVISVMCVIVTCAGIYLSRLANDTRTTYGSIDTTAELREYIENHSDDKFEFSRSSGLTSTANNVWFVSKSDYSQNYQIFNCTYYRHPDYTRSVVAFGTDNMYSNLLKDSVYFVDNDEVPVIDNMRIYLEKYYSEGNPVICSLISTASGSSIYKLKVSEE